MPVSSQLQDAAASFQDQPRNQPRIQAQRRPERSEVFRLGSGTPEKWRIVEQIVDEGGCRRWKMKDRAHRGESYAHHDEDNEVESFARDRLLARSTPRVQEIDEVVRADGDILCGRGKHSVHNLGNKYFRGKCFEVEFAYNTTARNSEKQAIVKQLLSNFESEGRRFLNFDESKGTWVLVPRNAAVGKIRQCIKDIGKASRRGGSVSSASSMSSAFTNMSSRSRISSMYSAASRAPLSASPRQLPANVNILANSPASRASLPSSPSQRPNMSLHTNSADSDCGCRDDGSMTSNISDITGGTSYRSRPKTLLQSRAFHDEVGLKWSPATLALQTDTGTRNGKHPCELPVLASRFEHFDLSETSTLCSSFGRSQQNVEASYRAGLTEASPPSDAAVKADIKMFDRVDNLVGLVVRVNSVSEAVTSDTSSTSESVLSMPFDLDLGKDFYDLEAILGQEAHSLS